MVDVDEDSAWLIVAADRMDRCMTVWHDHRILFVSVLALAIFLLCAFSIKQQRRVTAERSTSPSTEEKEGWISPKGDTRNRATKESDWSQRGSSKTAAKVVSGKKPGPRTSTSSHAVGSTLQVQPLVFYCSLTGTAERLSQRVSGQIEALRVEHDSIRVPIVHDLSYIDLDNYFISGPEPNKEEGPVKYFYLIVLPSYDIDTIITNFLAHLDETHHDFRIDTAPLSNLVGYSVFGIGDGEGWPTEEKGYCSQAIEADRWMAKLTGRKRAFPIGLGDVKGKIEVALDDWVAGVSMSLNDLIRGGGSLGDGVPGSGDPDESDVEDGVSEFPDNNRRKRQKTSKGVAADLEDVGGAEPARAPLAIDFTTTSIPSTTKPQLKAMVPKSSPTYAALTKQGYTIVGSHSGVKICRWTKSALRGRGSCYKNSFYGIASHLCMETTPSLSCSNKCVFCWRHGTNPVSTTWRWEVDPPDLIFEGAKQGHYQKIKMMRGVPGVRAERFQEAMRIRHCALSLVGEPIFYPHINEFLALLHGEHISSFLVCNAQHPAQLRALKRVTQLYVSIDASNRESLRRIDRPLHRDFWERFQECLDILRERRFEQRTVFRLTLVKGFNVDEEVEGYADLVAKGLPCFVEIKGVTYCGTSSAAGAGLTMQNVPFYEEVVAFTEALDKALAKRGLEYGIAAEHAHSCCILLASKRFEIGGKWQTRIDYHRFFELLDAGEEFRPEDYCAETPEWALWGNGGFDPRDERVDRKGRPKQDNVITGRGDGTVVSQSQKPADIDF
jgi:tRNA wybutosine-synthesizing protein 1